MKNEEYSQSGDAITNIREKLGILDGDSPRPDVPTDGSKIDRPEGNAGDRVPKPTGGDGNALDKLKKLGKKILSLRGLAETIRGLIPRARLESAEVKDNGNLMVDMYMVEKRWLPDVWYDIIVIGSALAYGSGGNPKSATIAKIIRGDVEYPVQIENRENLGVINSPMNVVIDEPDILEEDAYIYTVKVLGADFDKQLNRHKEKII